MPTLLRPSRPLSWLMLCASSALIANCGDARDFSEFGGSGGVSPSSGGSGGRAAAAGGRSARGGEAGSDLLAGAPSMQGGAGGTSGSGEEVAGAGGADSGGVSGGGLSSGGLSGGVSASGGAPAENAGASGENGGAAGSGGAHELAEECLFHVQCTDEKRPFCNEAHRCVACLEAAHCPQASGECYAPSCVLGECRELAKPRAAACGSAASSACDSADTCDGAGHCLSNHVASGTPCDDGVYCNGADTCDAQGVCAHAGSPCSGSRKVCVEASQACTCDTTTRLDASYCGAGDEATDRAAANKAQSACLGCGTSNTDNYVRTQQNGCMEFRCKP